MAGEDIVDRPTAGSKRVRWPLVAGLLGLAAVGVVLVATSEAPRPVAQRTLVADSWSGNGPAGPVPAGDETRYAAADGTAVVSDLPRVLDAPRFVSVHDSSSVWSAPAIGTAPSAGGADLRPAPARPNSFGPITAQRPPRTIAPAVPRQPSPGGWGPQRPLGGSGPAIGGAPQPRGPSNPNRGSVPPQVAGAAPPPAAPDVSAPALPAQPMPAELPGSLSGPDIASRDAPSDDWFSPGHSPGVAQVDGDFVLGGGTLLFEILGTQPGLMYDQLQVLGDVLLDSGNVVFAFINGYVPDDPTDLFELIIAANIEVDFSGVDFYYGFFDPLLGDPSWDLHAPQDLGLYRPWDPGSGIAMTDQDGNAIRVGDLGTFDGFLGIQYAGGAVLAPPVGQPSQPFSALNIPVPVPSPLWLLAGGVLLVARVRRR